VVHGVQVERATVRTTWTPWAASARLCLGRWQTGWEHPAHAADSPALANGAPAVSEPERPRRRLVLSVAALYGDRLMTRLWATWACVGAARAERAEGRSGARGGAGSAPDPDDETETTTLTLAHWSYAGHGHTPGESWLAASVAKEIRLNRETAREALADMPDLETEGER
jgi:hypothetical protein